MLEPWRKSRENRVRALLEEGKAAFARGERDTALRACRKALADDPGSIIGHYLAGSIDAQAGSYETAMTHLERCVALGADFPEAYIHLGNVYRLTDDFARAAQSYRKAVEIDPRSALGHYNLALMLKREGAAEQALEHLACAQTAPEVRGEAVRLRVKTLIELGRYDAAADSARHAVEEDESCCDSWAALGYAQQKLHRPFDALVCYERALAMRGDDAELFSNQGIVLQDLGRMDAALASYDRALALNPNDALVRFHKALANLLMGDYAAGWPAYETRLISAERAARPVSYPRWDGTMPHMRTILVYGEQGLGDEIMFASCLPDLLRAARHCIVECSPKLQRLFARSFPDATVYAATAEGVPANIQERGIDVEVPLGSLPLYYRRSLDEFPRHAGYLVADPVRAARWRSKLDSLGPGLKVGLSWKGGTHKTRTPVRSMPLEDLLPLLQVPNVRFVSLQYTDGAQAEIQALEQSRGIAVTHWQEAIDDYDETAALVAALDITVTVCTSIVHLAGALGRPVWVTAPYSPEWRYGLAGTTMPWYPSARIYRQPAYGRWDAVIESIVQDLHALALCEGERAPVAVSQVLGKNT